MNQESFYLNKLSYETDSADLFDTINSGEEIILIDARQSHAYHEEHIPTAISFPHREMNEETVQSLSKDILIVTYCDGIGCNASTKAALKLTQFGFKVKELMGGIDWWKRDGYATEGTKSHAGHTVKCAC